MFNLSDIENSAVGFSVGPAAKEAVVGTLETSRIGISSGMEVLLSIVFFGASR